MAIDTLKMKMEEMHMFRKVIAILLTASVFLCLVACGKETAVEEAAPVETAQSSPTATPEPTPILRRRRSIILWKRYKSGGRCVWRSSPATAR